LRQAAISLLKLVESKQQHAGMFDLKLTSFPSGNRVCRDGETTPKLRLRKTKRFALTFYLGTADPNLGCLRLSGFGMQTQIGDIDRFARMLKVYSDKATSHVEV
jgi:hypothetical protein